MTALHRAEASTPRHLAQRGLFRLWLPAFVVFSALIVVWSLATPLGASPDEGAHIARAVSVDQGDLVGRSVHGPGGSTRFSIPSTYAQMGTEASCLAGHLARTARCLPRIRQSSKSVTVTDHVGRHPPLYYLVVGIPSIFTDRLLGVHLMRLISALLGSGFLALAFAAARRWSTAPLLPAAVAIAGTPSALFLAGTVNPSGLEISCAIAVWTAAVVLVTEHVDAPPRALLAVLAGSAAALALVRGDSPLWLLIIPVVLAPMWWARVRVRLLRGGPTLVALAVIVLAVAAALVWTLVVHALRILPQPIPADHTAWDGVKAVFGILPDLFSAQIGLFGQLDTPAPWITTTLWYLLVGAAIAIGVMVGRTRQLLTLALAVAAAILVPLAFAALTYGHDGLFEQARYFLPATAGIPIVALGCVRAQGRAASSARRLQILLGGAVAVGQFFAFSSTLHRYRVGIHGPIFGHGSLRPSQVWDPPLGALTLELICLAACAALVLVVLNPAEPPSAPNPPSALTPPPIDDLAATLDAPAAGPATGDLGPQVVASESTSS